MKPIPISITPCSPSSNISTNEKMVTEILVSHGGVGIVGGATETIYAVSIEKKWSKDAIGWKVTKIDGTVVEINPNFIIRTETKQLITIVTDVTAWANYRKVTCNQNIQTNQWLINENEYPEYTDSYIGPEHRKAKFISETNEIK